MSHKGLEPVLFPQRVSQDTKFLGGPELGGPTTARVENRIRAVAGSLARLLFMGQVHRNGELEFIWRGRNLNTERASDEFQALADDMNASWYLDAAGQQ